MTNPANDPSTVGLGALIKSEKFHIPKHQRDFKWDGDLIRQFFSDIEEVMDRGEDTYFVGLMVFQKSDGGELIVLDGQQRITTCLLLFSAVRNWLANCVSQEIKDEAIKVEEWFLGASELGQKTPSPKLTLNAINDPDFIRFVVGKSASLDDLTAETKKISKKHRRLPFLKGVQTAKQIIDLQAGKYDSEQEAAEFFYAFAAYIRDRVRVVSLTVPTDGAAYSIFETLNDRGLSLAPLDLIKNLIFSRIDSNKNLNLEHAQERWTEMLALLQNVDPNKFIRVFWLANHELVQGPKIFAAFKEKYKTSSSANQASQAMRAAAEYYASLGNPDDPVWLGHTKKTKAILSSLNVIGATQVHPVLLAMLTKNFSASALEDSVRALETVLVRYQLIGSGRPGRLETLGARVAKKITNGEIKSAARIRSEYKELMTSDDEFVSAFERFSETTSAKCHYLLTRLEVFVRSQADGADGNSPAETTVEHILPKKPGPDWAKETADDKDLVDDCVHRLGNMCLLGKDKLGNSGFDTKKEAYAKSVHELTKAVAQEAVFNRALIDKRQKLMAKNAKVIWRFPD